MIEIEEISKINFPKVRRGDYLEGGIVLSVVGGYFHPEFREVNIQRGGDLITLRCNHRGEVYVWEKKQKA